MSRVDSSKALLTRERAFEDAWIIYQSRHNRLSSARIAELALFAAIRLADGSFSPDGGLGKAMAERTIAWRLSERRREVVEELIQTPLAEMVVEAKQAIEEEISWWATMSRPYVMHDDKLVPNPPAMRMKAREGLLRAEESKRKLLGIDRPQQVEVTHTDATEQGDDRLMQAVKAAKERTVQMKASVPRETSGEG